MQQPAMEILAPAGDEAMMRAAVFSGADCVYMGVQGFNARAGAANFDTQALKSAVSFCHARACRVYAALNTLVLPGREEAFEEALAAVAAAGCDAVIVQDLSAAERAQRVAPGLPLHASTQMSVHSKAGVEELARLGFSRAILARELSRDEISEIAEDSPLELEVFVHGALCVSVSGQCYYSVQQGGRSANLGACASPCRLAVGVGQGGAKGGPKGAQTLPKVAPKRGQRGYKIGQNGAQNHVFSLKDLSLLSFLPELSAMGVKSAKIEGRLRGPEYVAAVVDAARKALRGETYDEAFLQALFSRSGFTNGWYTAQNDGTMFGTRTETDSRATREALPRARDLYRRERPRVPVFMSLHLTKTGGLLRVTDTDGNHAQQSLPGPLAPAQTGGEEALRGALQKTGGTPFFVPDDALEVETEGLFVPLPLVNAARREALDALLALRSAPKPTAAAAKKQRQNSEKTPPPLPAGRLAAFFADAAEVPEEAWALLDEVIIPLSQWQAVPKQRRSVTWLGLPRVLLGPAEAEAAQQVQAAAGAGFAGFEAHNLAHFGLCRGHPVRGGYGLNLANAAAVRQAAQLGCRAATLSFELALPQLRALAASPQLAAGPRADIICYGHLPLILTRACPLQAAGATCAGCEKQAILEDRRGAAIALRCRHGLRETYNPVPLWMADRLDELPAGGRLLLFHTETAAEAAAVLQAFAQHSAAVGPFTRGCY